MQTSFLAAKYLRCFLQKGGEACICLWRSNCSMFNSTPVYPQGGETHLSDFILLTPGQKAEPTGRFCLYKINVFLIKFRVCGCQRRLLMGVCWFHRRWCSCPNPLSWEGRITFKVEQKHQHTRLDTHTSELLVLLCVNTADSDKLNHSGLENANLIKCD